MGDTTFCFVLFCHFLFYCFVYLFSLLLRETGREGGRERTWSGVAREIDLGSLRAGKKTWLICFIKKSTKSLGFRQLNLTMHFIDKNLWNETMCRFYANYDSKAAPQWNFILWSLIMSNWTCSTMWTPHLLGSGVMT